MWHLLEGLGRGIWVKRTVSPTGAGVKVVGLRVYCLAPGGVNLTSAAGRMTMQVIATIAEFERDLLIERTQAGLARAKAQGKALGRPQSMSGTEAAKARERLAAGGGRCV